MQPKPLDIRVLGSSGGLGGSTGSTCIQVTPHILIDAGSGLAQLSLESMRQIKHVFLTHAHFDHIAALPTFLVNLFDTYQEPVTVYGSQTTINTLKECIFNFRIWPDLTQFNSPKQPLLRYVEIHEDQKINLDGLTLTPFHVDHTQPTFGYSVHNSQEQFVFAADSRFSPALVKALNQLGSIDTLMVECSFPDRLEELAQRSGHMTPSQVKQLYAALQCQPKQFWISHLKPSYENELRAVLQEQHPSWKVLTSQQPYE